MLKQSPGSRQFFRDAIIPIGLLVLNIVLKLAFLGTMPLANDEPFSLFHAQLPLAGMIDALKTFNNPPGFEIILHYWIDIFGISVVSARFLPMLQQLHSLL